MIISTLKLDDEYRQMIEEKFPELDIKHIKLSDLTEEELAKVEILFTYGYDMKEENVKKMTNLKWVHIGQSGMDSLPFDTLAKNNIFLTNSKGINSVTIAEYVMCMMLNHIRNTFVFYEANKRKEWDKFTHLDELAGKTIGIFGLGMVGKEIAKRAKAFDMTTYGLNIVKDPIDNIDLIFTPDERIEMLKICDYVVICMPLTNETKYIISKKELEAMKSTAILLNVGRGPIIKTTELIDCLNHQGIAGAILDVFETEPLEADSPLWSMENVLITPHIAGDRQASYMPRMMNILCNNLEKYPNFHEMKNAINLKFGF
ncbi:MAG: D-2-hydroxyacid dehydrogenase [Herbinix sp.]|nr:D-2-hydroxyacid dehydrogenase [Herbinix sp.]